MYEIPEVKSLRWLSNMFPFVENPKDETDKMSNAIHIYCSAGADKIEELVRKIEWLLPVDDWSIENSDTPDFGVSDNS